MKLLNVLSLFSGIGAFEKALENLGIQYNLVGYCEIDKHAAKAYSLIHNVPESKNYGDITRLDEKSINVPLDLITYGFPCQDISNAGKKQGFEREDGSKTRSGLFFDALRIIEGTKPKIAIAENVKNLVSKRFSQEFEIVLSSLESAGYNNYWKVMNSADYGMPQSRERVFIVSIRKDIDDGSFQFPLPIDLTRCMGDFLDLEVDEKYYLTDEQVAKIEYNSFKQEKLRLQEWGGTCNTLCARDFKGAQCVIVPMKKNCKQVANLNFFGHDNMNRVYSPTGVSPTLCTVGGGQLGN